MQDSTIGFTSSLYGFNTAFLPEKGRHWPLINGQDKGILGLENDEMANRLHQKIKKIKILNFLGLLTDNVDQFVLNAKMTSSPKFPMFRRLPKD